jgi:hypothetical protein
MSIDQARETKLLTQKDLMSKWGCTVRTIQRTRKEFGLLPVDFYGVNPLFTPEDVARVEEMRRVKRMEWLERKAKAARKSSAILTVKDAKRIAKTRVK